MPGDAPRARSFVGSIPFGNDVLVLVASPLPDPGVEVKDIFERFHGCSFLPPPLRPHTVASDLAHKNSTKLSHAQRRYLDHCFEAMGFNSISSPKNIPEEEHHGAFGSPCTTYPKNYREIKKEDLEQYGFQFISSPKYITEISKEESESLGFHFIESPSNVPENKKEHLEALVSHFITSPKNAPGIKKECPELWRLHVATYPKFVPGMARLSPWLHALGTSSTSGNSMDAHEFILDSGSGCHVVHEAVLLINPRDPPPGSTHVKAADGALLKVSCFGDIETNDFLIPDVCRVLGLRKNLVSVGQLASTRNVTCNFNWDGCEVISLDDGSLVGRAVLRGPNMYVLTFLRI